MKPGVLAIAAFLFLNSCKHEPLGLTPLTDDYGNDDNNNNGGGNNGGGNNNGGSGNTCDTNVIYFNQDVLPILASNCAKSGCHDVGSHEDGIILNSYANVMATADVVPYNLSAGDLYEVITTHDADDAMPPPPETSLSDEQIGIIEDWIMQGAQNLTCVNSGCDSVNVSYTGEVWPIIQNKCKGCHSGSAPGGNILLTDYNTVSTIAANPKFMGSILHASGYSAMPKNAAMLSTCEIGVLRNWIAEGKQNN